MFRTILTSVIIMEQYRRMRDLREDRDMTQAQVGAALHISQRTYA